jgi:hypothetical protein
VVLGTRRRVHEMSESEFGERLGGQVPQIRSNRRVPERAHLIVRKRGTQEVRPEMGCMGVQDPSDSESLI